VTDARSARLRWRGGVYVVAGTLAASAAAQAFAHPSGRDAAVAGSGAVGLAAVMAVPVVLDARFGRRTSSGPAVSAVLPFVLPWSWTVLAVVVAAVASGLSIRRYRSTPGGMALGASGVIVSAATGAAVVRHLLPATPSPFVGAAVALVGAAAYFAIGSVVLATVGARWDDRHRPLPRREHLVNWVVAMAGAALAVESPWLLSVWALVVAAVTATGAQRQRLLEERARLSGVIALAETVRQRPTRAAVTNEVLDAVRKLLHTPSARLGAEPDTGELGVAITPSTDDDACWLVAGDRRGHPPAYLGRYRDEEAATLRLIAAVANGAWDTAALLEQARYEARHDSLSGLLNRLGTEEALAAHLAAADEAGNHLGIVFIDLDNLKAVNDTYDHEAGDALIVASARRLVDIVARHEQIGRWGGDEFVVIIDGDPRAEDLLAVAERIVEAFRAPVTLPNGATTSATVSVGAVLYPDAAADLADVIQAADCQAIAVKRAGKNGYALDIGVSAC
jgi:diguanylate cyclase (GGDEF)-like protein